MFQKAVTFVGAVALVIIAAMMVADFLGLRSGGRGVATRTMSCEGWMTNQEEWASINSSHATGLLTGMAMGSRQDLWSEPSRMEAEDLADFVTDFCKTHPNQNVTIAVANLAFERTGSFKWVEAADPAP